MRIIASSSVLLLSAWLGAVVPDAVAQEATTDTLSSAAVCERASRALRRPQGREAYSQAVANLPACGLSGARELQRQWDQTPADTTALRVLGEVTPRLRDRQVFDAVIRVFRDPSRPRDARLAALEALMGYYEPGLGAKFVEPAQPVQYGGAYVMMGEGDPPAIRKGPSPLAGERKEILQTLDYVCKQDSDERVRLIAAYVHSRLSKLS